MDAPNAASLYYAGINALKAAVQPIQDANFANSSYQE